MDGVRRDNNEKQHVTLTNLDVGLRGVSQGPRVVPECTFPAPPRGGPVSPYACIARPPCPRSTSTRRLSCHAELVACLTGRIFCRCRTGEVEGHRIAAATQPPQYQRTRAVGRSPPYPSGQECGDGRIEYHAQARGCGVAVNATSASVPTHNIERGCATSGDWVLHKIEGRPWRREVGS